MKLAPLLLLLIAGIAAFAKLTEPELRRYIKISQM